MLVWKIDIFSENYDRCYPKVPWLIIWTPTSWNWNNRRLCFTVNREKVLNGLFKIEVSIIHDMNKINNNNNNNNTNTLFKTTKRFETPLFDHWCYFMNTYFNISSSLTFVLKIWFRNIACSLLIPSNLDFFSIFFNNASQVARE